MFEVGENVLCVVERIEGTIVFVKILANGKEVDGSIITAEIAPGRIRNLRDYVVPKKKIVCKILRMLKDNIELSLRRVTPKERKEVMDKFKQEMAYMSVFKKVLAENFEKIIEEIKKEGDLYDFVLSSKENPKKLESLAGKENAKKILEILNSEKRKNAFIKKEIALKSSIPNGIEMIKEVLGKADVEVKYVSAGKYFLRAESENMKKADGVLKEAVLKIEKEAKQKGLDFSIIEK